MFKRCISGCCWPVKMGVRLGSKVVIFRRGYVHRNNAPQSKLMRITGGQNPQIRPRPHERNRVFRDAERQRVIHWIAFAENADWTFQCLLMRQRCVSRCANYIKNHSMKAMVPGAGIEPARLSAGDFESPASTNFTTRAGRSEAINYGTVPG